MEFLESDHNNFLVIMSWVVALVSGFTGLSLTRGLSQKPLFQRQVSIALASIALGGGIWSMHFVAMLGLQLPVLFYYDAAITLVSALVAILMVGVALVILHTFERTIAVICAAGSTVGLGILGMHYIGMAGLQLCKPIYTPVGIIASSVVALGLCILAFWIAYGGRDNRNIVLGTVCFSAAVVSVHFLAMAGTNFTAVPSLTEFGPTMSNEILALGVIASSFVLFGTFLWVSMTLLVARADQAEKPEEPDAVVSQRVQISCERDGMQVFVAADDVVLVRADGHYTQVYTEQDRLFCAWPITEAAKRLLPEGFLQTHRSYLVNPEKVSRFERTKDKGRCVFDSGDLPPAPVSRSKLKIIQNALGAQRSASHAG